ncbi:MAG: GNAT family N-acetyltransferase [Thermoplasmata archaeon]|nr:GNAT family N-acetyltransferase [Thermoplasmata archaeon]
MAFAIREKVFVKEQKVPHDIEYDEYDKAALHVICFMGGEVVGTGRMVIIDDEVKIGRVAVMRPYRGKGIGTFIILRLINEAEFYFLGRPIVANVQLDAKDFYSKFGFKPTGHVFTEAGIEHIQMVFES